VHETTTLLLVTLPNIQKITYTLSNKPVLIWLLRTPSHLQYATTLPCNLSLMAYFADINVSRGSAAIYTRRGWIFNIHLTANLLESFSEKNLNQLRFDKIMVMRLWPCFLAHTVVCTESSSSSSRVHCSTKK